MFFIYNEYLVLTNAIQEGSITYNHSKYHIMLVGIPALLAHLANLFVGVLAAILSMDAYAKYKK